ncbi:44012_t:CDS:2, partial [Gigaspora margarita]
NQFQEIKNMTPIKSHNITIGRSEELPIITLGANMINDKYQTTPIKQIFRPTLSSHSLNSKPDYSHYMTTSGNLFSGIYKPIMNKQSEVNYREEENFYP